MCIVRLIGSIGFDAVPGLVVAANPAVGSEKSREYKTARRIMRHAPIGFFMIGKCLAGVKDWSMRPPNGKHMNPRMADRPAHDRAATAIWLHEKP
jgi:hypothetical protein